MDATEWITQTEEDAYNIGVMCIATTSPLLTLFDLHKRWPHIDDWHLHKFIITGKLLCVRLRYSEYREGRKWNLLYEHDPEFSSDPDCSSPFPSIEDYIFLKDEDALFLESEVRQLEREGLGRERPEERRIEDLKKTIAEKDARIAELEARLAERPPDEHEAFLEAYPICREIYELHSEGKTQGEIRKILMERGRGTIKQVAFLTKDDPGFQSDAAIRQDYYRSLPKKEE